MLIAHGPLAVLSTNLILKKDLDGKRADTTALIYLTAFISGILPDFDFFYLIALGKPAFLHHSLISHTPIFWIALFLLVKYLYPKILSRKVATIDLVLKAFLIGTLSHLLVDTLMGHIPLFYPVYTHGITLLSNILPANIFAGYNLHPVFMIELGIVSVFAVFLLNSFLPKTKKYAFLAPIAYILTAIMTIFSLYLSTQVYKYDTVPEDSSNMPIYDTDNDNVLDLRDYDVNNTGTNNILSINTGLLLEKVEGIKKQKGTVVPFRDRSAVQELLYSFGALDPSRMIFASYIEANKAIKPVLELYYEEDGKEHIDLLFKYLNEENLLVQDDRAEAGKIVFFLDDQGEIMNVGISDENTDVLTVLDNETAKSFSIKEIREFYGNKLDVVLHQR